jgi:hypothetical protein
MKNLSRKSSLLLRMSVFFLLTFFSVSCQLVEDILEEHVPKKSQTFYGPNVTVGNGTARTFVIVDPAGKPTSVGINFSEQALNGLPDQVVEYVLAFPQQANLTMFKHSTLDWNPHGHDPQGVYTSPHFDIHFYMISNEERMTITGLNPPAMDPAPEAKYMAANYVQTPGRVPMMGAHWVDVLSAEFNGGKFTKTFIYGTLNKEVTYYEPMATLEYLLTKPSEVIPIRQPAAYQKNGYYPLKYSIKYNPTAKEYTISLEELTYRQGQ